MAEMKNTIRTHIEQDLLRGGQVADDDNLLLTGRLDSLAVMSLVAFIETEFQIAVPFEEVLIENFETVDAITAYVSAKREDS